MWKRRLGLAIALAGVVPVPAAKAADDPAKIVSQELKRFVDVFSAVSRESADPIPSDVALFQGAIPAMLRTLDPHSAFFTPELFEQLAALQTSERKGFGMIVSILPGRLIILQTFPGSPGARAGLSAGDEILAINDIDVAYLDVDQLTQVLDMARQRDAKLDVRHPGNPKPVTVTISPQMIERPSVDRVFHVQPGIGYLHITSFEAATGWLVKQAIEKLGGESLSGLVLDLRDNPGGAVEAAAEIASMFLAPDQLLFTVNGRHSGTQDIYVPRNAIPYTFPVAVLMNGGSASAAEILAGALQDHDRAVVFGESSYGKGLVQRVIPLSGNTGMTLTVSFYYTPSGRSIQKPLGAGQLGAATLVAKGPFRSDSGRPLAGGGGIQPDEIVLPAPQTRLQMVLDASGALTSFASEYRRTHPVAENPEITSDILDAFYAYVAARRIQPGLGEWSAHRLWIEDRLREELITLEFGVAKGEELEVRRDAVVERAIKRLAGGI